MGQAFLSESDALPNADPDSSAAGLLVDVGGGKSLLTFLNLRLCMPLGASRRAWQLLTWAPVAFYFTHSFFSIKQVSGRSMQPTLNPEPCIQKDVVLFDKIAARTGVGVRKGDVVSVTSPVNPNEMLVKRVVALPGEVIHTLPPYPLEEVKVPEGHIWVEGDEPFWTLDSNTWGPVPLALVDAKLSYILWPLNRIGALKPRVTRDTQKPRANAAHEPAWKRQKAEMEKEKWEIAQKR